MSITWKIPGSQPDPAAIARMRVHFPQPTELMPIAWFMGEITFIEYLATESFQTLTTKQISEALNEISGGIFCFPLVGYVPVWIAWFKYLLPDLLIRAHKRDKPGDFSNLWILVDTVVAVFNIYPQQITEEYDGFRADLVSTLATCAIPPHLPSEQTSSRDDKNLLFTDIWDDKIGVEGYGLDGLTSTEINSLILFCLKYFTVTEVKEWAGSLFQLDRAQWHLLLIFSLTKWRRFLNSTQNWNNAEEHFLRRILEDSGLLNEYWIPTFESLDEFLPLPNIEAFEQSIASNFSFDLFRAWTSEIWRLLKASPYSYLDYSMADELRICEKVLFPQGRGDGIVMAYDSMHRSGYLPK